MKRQPDHASGEPVGLGQAAVQTAGEGGRAVAAVSPPATRVHTLPGQRQSAAGGLVLTCRIYIQDDSNPEKLCVIRVRRCTDRTSMVQADPTIAPAAR